MQKSKKRRLSHETKVKIAKAASETTGIRLEDTLLVLEGICKKEENKSISSEKISSLLIKKLEKQKKYFINKNQNNEDENISSNPNFIFF